jgi:hypothetical protein
VKAEKAYRRQVDRVAVQAKRLQVPETSEDRWSRMASRFRMDPNRALDPSLETIASYLQPGDVLVDVGGGAGRVSLPLASRVSEVVNVEPSPGMCEQFAASAADAGITNARAIQGGWMEARGVTGDVVLVCNVTYFVRDIRPFIEKLAAAARRRVIISVWSVPPPDRNAPLFEAVMGEAKRPVPGHRELLAVLWEMGILPDVRLIPGGFPAFGPVPPDRDAAMRQWLSDLRPLKEKRVRRRLEKRFDELFEQRDEGWVPVFRPPMREMLITWPTA